MVLRSRGETKITAGRIEEPFHLFKDTLLYAIQTKSDRDFENIKSEFKNKKIEKKKNGEKLYRSTTGTSQNGKKRIWKFRN